MPIIEGEAGTPSKTLPGAKKSNKQYGRGPVTVYVPPEVAKVAVAVAVKSWNSEVGRTLFKIVDDPELADVLVQLGHTKLGAAEASPGAWEKNKKGLVTLEPAFFSSDAIAAAEDPKAYVESVAATVEHELGHAIGLAHPGPESNPYLGSPVPPDLKPGEVAPGGAATPDSFMYESPNAGIMGQSYGPTGVSDSEKKQVEQLRSTFMSKAEGAHAVAYHQPEQDIPPIVIAPPPASGGSSGGSSSGGSSSGGSSSSSSGSSSHASSGPHDSPETMARMSEYQSLYVSIWGEPATEDYLRAAAKEGLNKWEFSLRERMKPAYFGSKGYKEKADSLAQLLHGLGVA